MLADKIRGYRPHSQEDRHHLNNRPPSTTASTYLQEFPYLVRLVPLCVFRYNKSTRRLFPEAHHYSYTSLSA